MATIEMGAMAQTVPYENVTVVTPDDASDLAATSRVLYVGTAGNVRFTTKGGQTVTVPLGEGYHPGRFTRIHATGTTASDMFIGW
mgnify:FL=1